MNNPFIRISKKGSRFIDSHCSINKMVIAKVPVKGIEDDIQGMKTNKIFSTKTIVKEIRSAAEQKGINLSHLYDTQIPLYLEEQLCNDKSEFHNDAKKIIEKFGHRLGLILLTLKTAYPENRKIRDDWNDEHWEYYKNIKKIVIVGGLANGIFGRELKKYALEVFEIANVEPYELIFFDKASHFGVLGCAKMLKSQNSTNVLFDFGQTNIKRCIIKREKGEVIFKEELENRPSWFMMDDITDPIVLRAEAQKLHNNFVTVIADTFRMARERYILDDEIIISIASYTVDGKLNDLRGGYAKLTTLTDNGDDSLTYEEYLQRDLRQLLKRNVSIKLIHDGSAMAKYFSDYEDTVCFSIGTAFGVGFPDL